MARTLTVNGEQVELPRESVTAREIKQQLEYSQDSSVVIVGENGQNVFVADNESIPADAREVSIIPRFQYGADVE